MNIITIEQARAHCKTDAQDDEVLTLCANAAERACANLANRGLFVDQAALDTAINGLSATMSAAFTAHANAMEAAASLPEDDRDLAERIAEQRLRNAQLAAGNAIHGIVADDDIIAAILLTTGHFYRNREEVGTAKFEQLPMGAERIMRWYRRAGSL